MSVKKKIKLKVNKNTKDCLRNKEEQKIIKNRCIDEIRQKDLRNKVERFK